MTKVSIPDSSLKISKLGFGCARLAGGAEFRASAKLIEAALKCGITHFDTAPMYGSEELLGTVLAGIPEATIATKVGIPGPANSSAKSSAFRSLYRLTVRPIFARFPAVKSRLRGLMPRPRTLGTEMIKRTLYRDEVLRGLETSMRLLKRQRLDVYLIHEPEQFEFTDELNELFQSLQRDGAISTFGLAYGSEPPFEVPSFGSVEQCRYSRNVAPLRSGAKIRLFHGVLRHALSDDPKAGLVPAGKLIAKVLDDNAPCAVIFSASSRHQINKIAREFASGT